MYYLLLLISLWPIITNCQSHLRSFALHGKIEDGNLDSLKAFYVHKHQVYRGKNILIKENTFTLTDSIAEPIQIDFKLYKKGKNISEASIFVEPGFDSIAFSASSLLATSVPRNQTNSEYLLLTSLQQNATKDYDSALIALKSLIKLPSIKNDSLASNRMTYAISQIHQLRTSAYDASMMHFIKTHPGSFASIDCFYPLSNETDIETLYSLFNSLNASVKQSIKGKRVGAMLEAIYTTRQGYNVPDVACFDLVGNRFDLNQIWNQGPILLDFWASWCVPCIEDLPSVKKLYSMYKNNGLRVVFVSIDGKRKEQWEKAIAGNQLEPFQHFLVQGIGIDEITKQLAVQAIPDKILIDNKGKIVYRKVGSGTEQLAKALAMLFEK
jgi:thiol-disulfide isomerase/thioredoxin